MQNGLQLQLHLTSQHKAAGCRKVQQNWLAQTGPVTLTAQNHLSQQANVLGFLICKHFVCILETLLHNLSAQADGTGCPSIVDFLHDHFSQAPDTDNLTSRVFLQTAMQWPLVPVLECWVHHCSITVSLATQANKRSVSDLFCCPHSEPQPCLIPQQCPSSHSLCSTCRTRLCGLLTRTKRASKSAT